VSTGSAACCSNGDAVRLMRSGEDGDTAAGVVVEPRLHQCPIGLEGGTRLH
jgi:hypothetical protein